ncbi:PD-(D/E)XK nuclease family protein [candidate division KSB1 bacterium]|nr:PD-(D/E)XK nuclease family protein [candidate division KSB1 bacterium]
MTPTKFKYITFTEKLIPALFNQESLEQNTIFIFPTARSKNEALKTFQAHWQLTPVSFMTMEGFKSLLFPAQQPLLKEEKRFLAFFASLSPESRAFFKINNYFQSIELATQFFELWSELNDELVNESFDAEFFATNNAELLNWQELTWQRLCEIRADYQTLITRKGFDDAIFCLHPERMTLEALPMLRQVVFVNQFYYTMLEKTMIHTLAQTDIKTTIVYQLPHQFVDEKALRIHPFNFNDVVSHDKWRTQQISIIECNNDFAMMTAMLQHVRDGKLLKVLDINFNNASYAPFLSPEYFATGMQQRLTQTSVFHFFETLHLLVSSIVKEPRLGHTLIPINELLTAVLDDTFAAYFTPFPHTPKFREDALSHLYQLLDDEIKFLDTGGVFYQFNEQIPHNPMIDSMIEFVDRIRTLKSIDDLIQLIDQPNGIDIHRMLTDHERYFTDLLDVYYQAASDFLAIEQIDIVDNWAKYFGYVREGDDDSSIAAGILRLFTDYLKYKSITFTPKENESPRTDIIDFLDARNLSFDQVALLNIVEGKIPSSKSTPFLFTERQRKLLGLKTYDDIKLREKYYLYRFVLSSERVYLFTQQNIEQNIERSSFVEEIRLQNPGILIETTTVSDKNYAALYNSLLAPATTLPDAARTYADSFYRLRFGGTDDFTRGYINLTPYAVSELQANPFVYYIHQVARIQEQCKQSNMDFSARLLGNMVHDILNAAWAHLTDRNAGPLFGYSFSEIDTAFVEKTIDRLIYHKYQYYFTMPFNHAAIYFDDVMRPVIASGVLAFFKFLSNRNLEDRPLNAIPEHLFSHIEDVANKLLLNASQTDAGLPVTIHGRADLRLEIPNDNEFYIFDYKTGAGEKLQLLLYEYLYYLMDTPEQAEHVHSFFYNIMKEFADPLELPKQTKSKTEWFERFKVNLIDLINHIATHGYGLPMQRSNLRLMSDISRGDLYVARVKRKLSDNIR